MNIEDYGFKKENYIINGAGIPARIITTYRERYLSLAWNSGAIPVIILTKCDLVENYKEYISEIENVAIGVDVNAISCKTKEGLEDIILI